MIVVVSFRLYSFYFLFLYRHGVDDYLSLVYFQRVPWQTKLVDTFQSGCGPRWAAKQDRPLERRETYTFILSAIESASSRDYDIYWAGSVSGRIFPGEEKEESVAFCFSYIQYMTRG
jgi:hypothetical protein